MGMEVKFEHQRKKKRIGQCYNCQKFGHSAANCHAEAVFRHCAVTNNQENIQKTKRIRQGAPTMTGLTNSTIEAARCSQQETTKRKSNQEDVPERQEQVGHHKQGMLRKIHSTNYFLPWT
ncbi:hypothetical protein JTB14_031654 [Gonioctena quinquepunctata]|nr:hypothetical protein JTB14_031654 [Gonioctena quinquepunctata]